MKDKFIGSQKETWMEKAMLNDYVSEKNKLRRSRRTFICDVCQEGLQENLKLRFLNMFT